jgi:WD40 repeat protein
MQTKTNAKLKCRRIRSCVRAPRPASQSLSATLSLSTAAMLSLSAAMVPLAGCINRSLVGEIFQGSGTGGAPPTNDGSGGSAFATGGASGGGATTGACLRISTQVGQINGCGRTPHVAVSPDGQLLASVTETQFPQLHVWRLSDGALVTEPTNRQGDFGPPGGLGVAFSPDGKIIAAAGYSPGTVPGGGAGPTDFLPAASLWDAATGDLLRSLPTQCGFYASAVDFSHDGKRLVTAGAQGQIEIWRVADGTRLLAIPASGSIYTAHFSPDDTRLVTASYVVATVWNTETGAKIFDIPGLEDEMNETAFSPDGRWILTTAADGMVNVLDASGALVQTLTFNATNPAYFGSAAWIGNDAFVVDDWDGAVKKWKRDASGMFALATGWSEGMQTLGIAVLPDLTRFVVGGSDGFVFLAP